ETLAARLIERFGAPDIETARSAAAEEVAFAASLAEHPPDTLIAMHRTHQDGETRETFRTLRPRAGAKPLRAFAFLEVEGEAAGAGHEGFLAFLRAPSARPRRGRRSPGDRRVPESLSGAARAGAAAGGVRRGARAARGAAR